MLGVVHGWRSSAYLALTGDRPFASVPPPSRRTRRHDCLRCHASFSVWVFLARLERHVIACALQLLRCL
jgi:hypothetical protein